MDVRANAAPASRAPTGGAPLPTRSRPSGRRPSSLPALVGEVLSSPGWAIDAATLNQVGPHLRAHAGARPSTVPPRLPHQIEIGRPGDPEERRAAEVAQLAVEASGAPEDPLSTAERRRLAEVSIHTDEAAADSARRLGAAAYAVPGHVVFGASRYDPASPAGRRLITHELVHALSEPAAPAGALLVRRQAAEGGAPDPQMLTGLVTVGTQVVGQAAKWTPGGEAAWELESGVYAAGTGARIGAAAVAADEVVAVPVVAGAATGTALALGAIGIFVLVTGVVVALVYLYEIHKELDQYGGTLPPGGVPGLPPLQAGPQQKTAPEQQAGPQPAPAPATDKDRKQQPAVNRGNIHVQGDDVPAGTEPNFSWNQPLPMQKVVARGGLEFVKQQCTKSQLAARTRAFDKAATFIQNTDYTAPPPVFRSFFDTNPRNRVDVEIILGRAFA